MTGDPTRVLLVEDNLADAVLLREALAERHRDQLVLTHAKRLDEALARLARDRFDVVLLDLGLPDSQGLATLARTRPKAGRAPIVVLTGLQDEASALRALQEGAQDYLFKGDATAEPLVRAIRYAIGRRHAEDALSRSEERFRRYFELGLIGMAITSPGQKMLEVNDEICRILTYPREELLGKTWADLTHPEDADSDAAEFARVLAGETDGYTHDKRFVRKDGRVIDATLSVKCVRREDRAVDHFVSLLQDVTERNAAAKATRIREAELAHLARVTMMGQMATGLAHELNQPLAAILNYASVCLHQVDSGKAQSEILRAALDELTNETRRAANIISRLRSFVRKRNPHGVPADLNGVVSDSLNILDFKLRHHAVRPQLELAESLPLVTLDPVQIEQVLVNLVCNALEAMEQDEPPHRRLVLRTHLGEGGDRVEASVIDSGPGMAAENSGQLFQAFFSTKPNGLGLGLNISRSIIESHGGRLTATANPGRGMCFRFSLPVARGAQP